MELILASTSRYRREQMGRLGVEFRWGAPAVDEEALKEELGGGLSPRELAGALAEAKARSLAAPGVVVVGGDQLVVFEGEILGKPGTPEGAIAQLSRLAGETHQLITALAVWRNGLYASHIDETVLTMRRLDCASIERYVLADRPWDCAGSYKIEQRGITLFERMESEDDSAITGLPLIALTGFLRGLGFEIP